MVATASPVHFWHRQPPSLPGLAYWFDHRINLLTTGDAIAADGETVESWLDYTGVANNAASAGTPPTCDRNSTGSPWLTFDGVDNYLALDNSFATTSLFYVAWLAELSAGTPSNETIFGSAAAGWYIRHTNATTLVVTNGVETRTFTHAAATGACVHVVNCDGTTIDHYMNGVKSSAAGNSFGGLTLSEIGAENAGTPAEMRLGSVVMGEGTLTDLQISNLTRFLRR